MFFQLLHLQKFQTFSGTDWFALAWLVRLRQLALPTKSSQGCTSNLCGYLPTLPAPSPHNGSTFWCCISRWRPRPLQKINSFSYSMRRLTCRPTLLKGCIGSVIWHRSYETLYHLHASLKRIAWVKSADWYADAIHRLQSHDLSNDI